VRKRGKKRGGKRGGGKREKRGKRRKNALPFRELNPGLHGSAAAEQLDGVGY
jgi:hypothetical protein